jgi:hypothetical protein
MAQPTQNVAATRRRPLGAKPTPGAYDAARLGAATMARRNGATRPWHSRKWRSPRRAKLQLAWPTQGEAATGAALAQ